MTILHSFLLVSSLWRVLSITLSSQTGMPFLTTVTLNKGIAFKYKKTIHTKSSFSSSPSFLDITPALERYLRFIVSFTYNLHLCQFQSSPLSLVFTQINTLVVHSISVALIIAIELSHSSQLHISISFTSNSITKLLNNKTDNNTNK